MLLNYTVMNMTIKKRLLFIAACVLGLLTLAYAGHSAAYRERIFPGVRIDTLDVGGLTVDEATRRAKRTFDPTERIDLSFKDKKWPVEPDRLGARAKAGKSASAAFAIGRSGNFFSDLGARYAAWSSGSAVPVNWAIDKDKTMETLKTMSKAIDQQPVDARLILNLSTVRIEPHRDGRKLLFAESIRKIEKELGRKTKSIDLAVKVVAPGKTTESLKKLKVEKLAAEFSTSLSTVRNGRRLNIELAMRKLDDTYVSPGEVFSFNKVVGPRTRKAGFVDAPVIERGQLVQGIGGGICQVATTIYNAAMLTGLPTVQRSLHSNYISNYPAGRDATVVDGAIDFRFKNDTDGTLIIKTQVISNAVIFRIYGPNTGRVVKFSQPEVTNIVPYSSKTETDTALPAGAKIKDQVGVDGRTVRVTRKVTKGDKTLINETIVSRYTPRQEVIKMGPEPPPPPPTGDIATGDASTTASE